MAFDSTLKNPRGFFVRAKLSSEGKNLSSRFKAKRKLQDAELTSRLSVYFLSAAIRFCKITILQS